MGFWSKLFGGGRKKEAETAASVKEHELFVDAMIKTMAFVASSDGTVDDKEVKEIVAAYYEITGNSVEPSQVRAAIEVAGQDTFSIEACLEDAASHLSKEHVEQIMRAAVLVAAADENFDAAETRLLDHVATSLGFPVERIKELVEALH